MRCVLKKYNMKSYETYEEDDDLFLEEEPLQTRCVVCTTVALWLSTVVITLYGVCKYL